MSVEKMKYVTLTGDAARLDEVLKVCVDSGCFQPESAGERFASLKQTAKAPADATARQLLERLQAIADAAGKQPKTVAFDPAMTDEDCARQIDEMEKAVGDLRRQLDTLNNEIEYCRACATQLEHFAGMDVPLRDLFDCEFVDIRFGRLPVTSYDAAMQYAQRDNNVLFIPFSTDDVYCWGMYITPKDAADRVDMTFAVLFFERLHVPDAVSTPAEAIDQLKEQLLPDEQQAEELRAQLAGYWDRQDGLCDKMYSYLQRAVRLAELRKYAALRAGHFILIGWVPARDLPGFDDRIKTLAEVDMTVADSDQVEALSPPVRLKNRLFARPFEFYTKMFGMPTYGEIDPTAFVAITYTLLYGIMFADLGQGLVLALVGYFYMYKHRGMELGRLLLPCGLSGAFFGLIFGSVFGYEHWLDPLYRAVGLQEKPFEVMASQNIMTVLFGAVAIGVVLMLVALLVNVYSCFKQHRVGAALFSENGITGFVLYASVVALVLNMVLGLSLPTAPLVYGGVLLPIVLLWLKEPLEKLADGRKDWQPESWGGYLTQGFFELFEALLSYVTNTVSFLRVGAFALVHASMMMVFLSLAEMAGGVFGVILAVFGNVFVLALEGLLVGVQSLRLEFYEMFNRFFEGAGREFRPLQY